MIKKKEVVKLLELDVLAAGAKSSLLDCKTLDLLNVSSLALTVRANFALNATSGLRVHLVASPDDSVYDTQDYTSFDLAVEPGKEAQKTVCITPDPPYLKIVLENLDSANAITDIDIWGVLGYEE